MRPLAAAVAAAVLAGLRPRRAAARRLESSGPALDTSEDSAAERAQEASPARRRLRLAREALQGIDDAFVELFIENKGAAVRRELQRVIAALGSLPAIAAELAEEPGSVVDVDRMVPLLDDLSRKLALAVSWTREADDCWNESCGVQEIDEARTNYLEATDLLLQMETL